AARADDGAAHRAARVALGRHPPPRLHLRRRPRRRQDHGVHRPPRPRDPCAGRSRPRRSARAADARRLAAVVPARPRADTRHRVPPWARLRVAGRRQGDLLRRVAASHRADRARAGREHRRRRDPARAAAGGADSMIPEHVMRELRYIEVYTAKRIRNLRVGPYTSPRRGPGFDFDEHQPYRTGDDVRRIDWNVTARMGAPYVRHTHAERELNVMIAIDVSRSMELGAAHRSKKELMTFITGSLLFS